MGLASVWSQQIDEQKQIYFLGQLKQVFVYISQKKNEQKIAVFFKNRKLASYCF